MKTIKTITLLFAVCSLVHQQVKAQDKQIIPLQIGDTIPDFLFKDIKNASYTNVRASELYKKGLLILNFWATWCVPCVREMPTLDSLTDQFGKELSMICVTNQPDNVVENFLKSRNDITHLQFISGDTLLKKYFPHRIIPHNVWIDSSGVIKAVTNDLAVNKNNLQAFFNGTVKMDTKAEDLSFDAEKPYQVADTTYILKSMLSPYDPNLGNAGVRRANYDSIPKRIFAWNRTKTDLLWVAIKKGRAMRQRDWRLIEVHTKDSTGYFYPQYTEHEGWQKEFGNNFKDWAKKNHYCYELIFNKWIDIDDFYNYMADDLCRYFNVKAYIATRKTKCWVTTVNNQKKIPLRSTSDDKMPLRLIRNSNEKGKIICKKQYMADIAASLSGSYNNEPPFLDETEINYPIDLEIDIEGIGEGFTPEIVIEKFAALGLQIELKERDYPFLIIEDLN
uniref:Redoxin domain protein n=1 Tax=Sphingobacterium sp. (strain 21) TaxID=743722 RepID=F4C137_SPHS2